MKLISVQELQKKLKSNSLTLVDVRGSNEYEEGHIASAHLIPLGEVSLDTLPRNASSFVLYCQSGKRSAAACEKLLSEKPSLDIYSLDGGLSAWKELGCPVETQETLAVAGIRG